MDNPFVHAHVIVYCGRIYTGKMSNQNVFDVLYAMLIFWFRSWSLDQCPFSLVRSENIELIQFGARQSEQMNQRNLNREKEGKMHSTRSVIPTIYLGINGNRYQMMNCDADALAQQKTVTFGQKEEYKISLIDMRAVHTHTNSKYGKKNKWNPTRAPSQRLAGDIQNENVFYFYFRDSNTAWHCRAQNCR